MPEIPDVRDLAARVTANVERVILGKRRAIELLLTALLADRHVLIEDVPGTGKTMMVKALAVSLGASFARLQFTPDLLPSDVTGTSVWDPHRGEFRFEPGPVFHQIVLADEINRASPKTQSSLLECMEERQVSVDGVTRPLPRPFLVLATENPVDFEGTYPLPEAQLDRFGLRLQIGYPAPEEEVRLLDRLHGDEPLRTLGQVATPEEVLAAQERVREVYVDPALRAYLIDVIAATRSHPEVQLGASPRAAVALAALARARASLMGRDYVLPEDVKALAEPALGHRLILRPEARWQQVTPESVIRDVLARTPLPDQVRVRRGG
ncbi:MAG: MoxR family ATPase [Bacillota bacterium]|nr:MoxR family ATPase [Bacillota bacterium]